ncbi:hypothetical protein [Parapedobacter sp.]
MEKLCMVEGVPIRIDIEEGLVRITNDPSFRRTALGRAETPMGTLFDRVQVNHQQVFGRELTLDKESFIVEIWGHLYVHHLLLKYKRILKVVLVFGLYDRFFRSCEVIDCGERDKDPNRWLWDMLVPFRKILGRQLAKVRLCRFTEGQP